MKTTPKALKGLYTALGGSSPIADESKTVDVLNAISTKIGGDGGATRVPDAIDNIAAKADDLVIPTGTIMITENGENIDVAQYEKATVNVSGGGSSDFSTATVTLTNNTSSDLFVFFPNTIDTETSIIMPYQRVLSSASNDYTIVLYKGTALLTMFDDVSASVTGDIEIMQGAGCIVTGNGTVIFTTSQP